MPYKIQEKILKYRRWQDAHASRFGKLLLREKLNELGLDCSLTNLKFTDYGKPYLEENNLRFNISHSGTKVVCAFASFSTIGIDLEEVKPLSMVDFINQFTDYEWKQINASEDTLLEFYKLWTGKEAVIKAEGKGLSIPLQSISIQENKVILTQNTWHLKQIDLFKNYMLHVAHKNETTQRINTKLFIF
jgi:4'-phosphopantetheinyl transferase